jgi:hypothetical protein
MTMVNNVIEVLNYVIAARPLPLNSVIDDNQRVVVQVCAVDQPEPRMRLKEVC